LLNLYGHKLWDAPGILDGFYGVFGCESSHSQRALSVRRHLNGSSINPLYVFGGACPGSDYFHNKSDIFHSFLLFDRTHESSEKQMERAQTAAHFLTTTSLISLGVNLGFESLPAADTPLDQRGLGFGLFDFRWADLVQRT